MHCSKFFGSHRPKCEVKGCATKPNRKVGITFIPGRKENPSADMAKATNYTNGTDVQFNYSPIPSDNSMANNDLGASTAPSKKKKKKKKKRAKSSSLDPNHEDGPKQDSGRQFSVHDATINDPDAEYPTSRVIKVGPSGDLIVESLDDEYPETEKEQGAQRGYNPSQDHDFSIFHFHNEEEREFWLSLPDSEKKEILRVDRDLLMENLRNLRRNQPNKGLHPAPLHPGDHKAGQDTEQCTCSYCGRNSRYIEDELAMAYNQHLDVIANYLENSMHRNEIPRELLEPSSHQFEEASANTKHMLMEITHLHTWDQKAVSPDVLPRKSSLKVAPKSKSPKIASSSASQGQDLGSDDAVKPLAKEDGETTTENEEMLLMNLEPQEMLDILGKAKKVSELINPSTVQELVKYELLQRNIKPEAAIDESAKNLTEIFANIKKDDENGIAKTVEFIKCCSRLYKESNDQFNDVLQFLSNVADLIMKNDGKPFIDMLESLTDARNARANLIEEARAEEVYDDDDHEITRSAEVEGQVLQSPLNASSASNGFDDNELNQTDGEESPEEDDYDDSYEYDHDHDHDHDHEYVCDHTCSHEPDCEHDCEHDDYDHDDDVNDDLDSNQDYDDGEFDDEEERRGRRQEIRGFVMIQAINMIRARFYEAYERKISEDRTQKFIAELEAEEKAKKERELKKFQAKEKQKEKKRLQQQAREEEKKRKEAEELARKEEAARKQEERRREQMRKQEEDRLRKEAEKRKKIEALQKKEREQQQERERKRKVEEERKRLEARKAEEEACNREREKKRSQEEAVKKERQIRREEKEECEQKMLGRNILERNGELEVEQERHEVISREQSWRTQNIDANVPYNERSINSNIPLSSQLQRLKAHEAITGKILNTKETNQGLNSEENSAFSRDPFDDTEEYLSKQQQEILNRANNLTLDESSSLNPFEETSIHPGGTSTSPLKNPLLDQLNRARPESFSSISTPTPQMMESNPIGFSGHGVLPNRNSDFINHHEGFNGTEWGSGNSFVSSQKHSTFGAGQNSSQFSPFSSTAALNQINQPPVDMLSNPSIGGASTSNIPQSNSFLWSDGATTRNNSIWGGSTSETQQGGIWSSNNCQQPLPNGFAANNRSSFSEQTAHLDYGIIQKAAYEAYKSLLGSNQMMYGMAPVQTMFLITRAILGDHTLGMGDFLKALGANGDYTSEIFHDDNGSVVNIKMSQNSVPSTHTKFPPPANLSRPPMAQQFNQQTQFPFKGASQPSPFQQNQHFQLPMANLQHTSPQPFKSMNVPPPGLQPNENESAKPSAFQFSNTISGSINPLGYGQHGSIW